MEFRKTILVLASALAVSGAPKVMRGQDLGIDVGTAAPAVTVNALDGKAVHIRLVRQGSFCRPDPTRVRQELTRLWRSHRRLYPITRDYLHAFTVPRGSTILTCTLHADMTVTVNGR